MPNSRQKGARGERDAASCLRQLGHQHVRRGVQYQGGPDSPDVVGVPHLHLEVKWVERLNIWKALEQASKDAGVMRTPGVMFKRNRSGWHIAVEAEYFTDFAMKWLQSIGYQVTEGAASAGSPKPTCSTDTED